MKSTDKVQLSTALGALGVVYGDIGTSPLYAFKECLAHLKSDAPGVSDLAILGILSLIIWTLVLLVTVKYLTFVMRADNQGEGGILALMSLAFPEGTMSSKRVFAMIAVGVFGAALLYGDGIITPAISVLSAMEGLGVAAPRLSPFTIPFTLAILAGLFSVQWKGTEAVGKFFGPIMLMWFVTLAVTGIVQIFHYPAVLSTINPLHGARFLLSHGKESLIVMGGVFLVATGAEALYADMGHFGRKPIALAWRCLVFPSLILNYLGQGALALRDTTSHVNPFYHMIPGWMQWPMIVLAAAATVIASQALISGSYSLTMQAVRMGYVPRINIRHTSHEEHGQIYIPFINTMLAIGCMLLVIGFKSSDALASAYGIAVTLTMIATTLLLYFAARGVWKWGAFRIGALCAVLLLIEGVFLAANATKIMHGGWLPLCVGAAMFTLMTTWKRGRALLRTRLPQTLSLSDFIASTALSSSGLPKRVPGTAIFLAGQPTGTPLALLHNLKHNRVLHERNIVLTIRTSRVPYVPKESRVEIKEYSDGFFRIIAHFGFMETPTVTEVLEHCALKNFVIDPQKTSFFLGRETIVPTNKPGMARWRQHVFVVMSRQAQSAAEFFKLPANRVVELGQRVEI